MTAALTPDILARLNGDGVTPGWCAEQLGIGRCEAARLLKAVGAVTGHGGRYHMPGTRPPYALKLPGKVENQGSTLDIGRDRS